MKLVALAVALLLATSHAWADSEDPTPLHTGQPAPGDGVWLSSPVAARMAAKYSGCEADREQLKAALEAKPIEPATGQGWLVAGLAGLVVGLVAGVLIKR